MVNFERLYHIAFNAETSALRALEKLDIGTAREILRTSQQRTEELYLEDGGNPPEDAPSGE